MENKTRGGVEASSTCLDIHSKKLVYFRYMDHAEVRNATLKFPFNVILKEAVGWIIYENDVFLILISDRSIELLPDETRFNFLVIIKSDILEMKEIKINSLISIIDCGKR